MKKIISTLLILVCCITLSSCNSKQRTLDRLKAFPEELSDNYRDFSEDDWDDAIIQYEEITDELDQYDYTSAERHKIRRLKAKCMGIYAKGKAKGVLDMINDFKGVYDEFQGNSSDNDDDYDY